MLSRLISAQISSIGKMLNKSDWSDRIIDRAIDMLDRLADRIERLTDRNDRISDRHHHQDHDNDRPVETAIDMELGGSAEAVGEHTIASADLRAKLTDTDNASFAVTSSTFRAAAEGGAEFALTDAYCDVDGADFVFSRTVTTTGRNWETTTTKVIAVDFAFLDNGRPIMVTPHSTYTVNSYQSVADGNVATADFDVKANAEDTLADVYAGVLAIEDTYSGSSIDAMLAIG